MWVNTLTLTNKHYCKELPRNPYLYQAVSWYKQFICIILQSLYTKKCPFLFKAKLNATDKRPHDNERCLMLKVYHTCDHTIPLLYVASFLLFSSGLQHVKGFKKPSKLSFDIELSVHEIECRLATQMVHILFSLGNMIWLIVKCQQRYIKSQHGYWCDLILIATQEIHKESCSNWPRNIFVAVFDDWVVQYSLYVQTAAWLAGPFGGNKVEMNAKANEHN